MLKKIKFPLKMKDEVQVRTIEELREHFDLTKAVAYFLNGKLQTWLEQRYYDSEATAVRALKNSDPDFHRKLCEILGAEYKEDDIKIDIDLVKERDRRLNELKQYTSDQSVLDKIDQVAFNQEELAYLLDEGVHDIYLCNNSFSIPIRITNKKYIGIGKVIAVIHSDWEVDFWVKQIEFVNVEFNPEYEEIHNPTPEKLYQMGYGFYRNGQYYLARDYYLKAMKAGNSDAFKFMADEYRGCGRFGDCVFYEPIWLCGDYLNDEKNLQYVRNVALEKGKIAEECLMKAVSLGNTDAMVDMAENFFCKKKYSESIKWYQKAADAGNTVAIIRMAERHLHGDDGYVKDEEKAIKLYEKAISLGDAYAMKVLTKIYEGKKDYTLHHQWFRTLVSSRDVDGWKSLQFFLMLERNGFALPDLDQARFRDGILDLCDRLLSDDTTYEDEDLFLLAAKTCNRLDCFDKAMQLVGKALDITKGSLVRARYVYDCLGDIYKDKGDCKNAIKAYEKSIENALILSEPPNDKLENNAIAMALRKKIEGCRINCH